ncbi:MAG: FHA domain-containing protein [Planctomycetes bacterium]|nr:FHA domain-containing protein [Planctomycetota bacterium]
MKLTVNQTDGSVKEFRFKRGPIYIGRHTGCQVFLPDKDVSRKHAVVYDQGVDWILEDMDSPNRTFLNGTAIHKATITSGDMIRITDFSIRVDISANNSTKQNIKLMEDTFVPSKDELHVEIRHPESLRAAPIKMPAKRAKDFARATRKLSACKSIKSLHKALVDVLLPQLRALDVWVGLRTSSEGEMDCFGGRKVSTERVQMSNLAGTQCIEEIMKRCNYVLIPDLPREVMAQGIRSAIIAPVLIDGKCRGVLYAENSTDHEHYVAADLDYLMLIAIHAAAVLDNL